MGWLKLGTSWGSSLMEFINNPAVSLDLMVPPKYFFYYYQPVSDSFHFVTMRGANSESEIQGKTSFIFFFHTNLFVICFNWIQFNISFLFAPYKYLVAWDSVTELGYLYNYMNILVFQNISHWQEASIIESFILYSLLCSF